MRIQNRRQAMPTTTIRAGAYAHGVLREIASARRISLADALDLLAREHEDKKFWDELNAAYARLTPEEIEEERTQFDGTLMDGLEDE